jgi:hypothetical protein
VADTEANFRLTRRTAVRAGAVALALVGVVVLAVRPATGARAEAHFDVPVPLVVNDAIGAIDRAGGASATADGRRITVVSSASDRAVARAHAVALAHTGLDGARQHLTAVETQQADVAKVDRAQAATQLATLTSRTGLSDPKAAYRQRVALVQRLEERLAVASSTGQPVDAINAQLAESQQAAFELQLQVTRYNELIQTEATAGQRELEATRVINALTPAAGSESIQVSDHATGIGLGVATGVAALVVAGVVWIFGNRRRRPAPARAAAPVSVPVAVPAAPPVAAPAAEPPVAPAVAPAVARAESEPAALEASDGHGSRYLEFYRALAPSSPTELDPSASQVDLVGEEGLEESADTDAQPAHESDSYRP